MNRLVLLVLLMLFPAQGWAASVTKSVNEGNESYREGQFDTAISQYEKALEKDAESSIIHYNLGAGHYKKKDYPSAIEHFQKALLADDQAVQQNAQYNLGNSFYRQGITKEDDEIDEAIKDLETSLGHYEKVMTENVEDDNANFNHGFVSQELERLRLKKMQQQHQQQQQQQNQDQQSSDDSQSQDQNQQSQQDQQNQDQQNQSQQQNQDQGSQGEQDEPSEDESEQDSSGAQDDGNESEEENQDSQSSQGDQGNPSEEQQQQGETQGDFSRQEALMMLQNYENNEEPQGLLNFIPQQGEALPVGKDW